MTSNPLISIIIPVYNRSNIVNQTLESVINQSYPNWECIIVDDGSTDGTQEIVKSFIKEDFRFKFFQRNREPKGASICRNIGLENSNGEYIIFLDSDDLLVQTCLEFRLKSAFQFPENDFWVFKMGIVNLVQGDTNSVWNELKKEIDDLQRFILQDAPWSITGPFWRKAALVSLGGFNEKALCWQDWELNVRSLIKNFSYWKDIHGNIDSYYRKSIKGENETISGFHNDISHILFRVDLFESVYNEVIVVDSRDELKHAFAVLFYRLFIELYHQNQQVELRKLLKLLKRLKIYTFFEFTVISLFIIQFQSKNNERRKVKYLMKLLCKINRYKFDNKVNNTFLK